MATSVYDSVTSLDTTERGAKNGEVEEGVVAIFRHCHALMRNALVMVTLNSNRSCFLVVSLISADRDWL